MAQNEDGLTTRSPLGEQMRHGPGSPRAGPGLALLDATAVRATLDEDEARTLAVVQEAYRAYEEGRSVNPSSQFLRFPQLPDSRIIALPAMAVDPPTAGVKWISSFPGNLALGRARASSVIVLNELETGYPIAVLEGAAISAARTAGSAAVIAAALMPSGADDVGVVGSGLIARETVRYLAAAGIRPGRVRVHDLEPRRSRGFIDQAAAILPGTLFEVVDVTAAITRSDLVILATVASQPHLTDPDLFRHRPVVLHLSLRDLGTEIIRRAENIVDDPHHVMTANTSLHLASMEFPGEPLVAGTVGSLLLSPRTSAERERLTVVSPFGLGVLDISLATDVLRRAQGTGRGTHLAGFFSADTVPFAADGTGAER